MVIVKKFATLFLCLGVLAWGGPVAANPLLSPAMAANSMHYANTGSHSVCGTTQAANGGTCGGCAHACSAVTLTRHTPFFRFTADTTRTSIVSLTPINAFPPPLPPPRA